MGQSAWYSIRARVRNFVVVFFYPLSLIPDEFRFLRAGSAPVCIDLTLQKKARKPKRRKNEQKCLVFWFI